MVVVIFHMHKYFGVKKNVKNEYIRFYKQLEMFSCMKISCTCCQHLGPQILILVNTKNQPNGQKKNNFPCSLFRMDYVTFKNLVLYII
jgi:hypothetical protein